MPREGLTPKQAAFVREYLIDRNATQAAIRAGYSAAAAKEQGSRLLTNANVAESVAQGEQKAEKRARKSLDDIIARYEEFAFEGDRDAIAKGSLDSLMKHYGYLQDKLDITTGGEQVGKVVIVLPSNGRESADNED